jgi:hypothetical protein
MRGQFGPDPGREREELAARAGENVRPGTHDKPEEPPTSWAWMSTSDTRVSSRSRTTLRGVAPRLLAPTGSSRVLSPPTASWSTTRHLIRRISSARRSRASDPPAQPARLSSLVRDVVGP